MLSINMIRTSFSIIAITLLAVSSNSITSPDVCLSNLECSSTAFCNGTIFSQLTSCAPRLPENAVCNSFGLSECQEGLTCTEDDSSKRGGRSLSCQLRVPRGAQCSLDASRPCLDDLICDRNTKTCQPFTDGFAGTPCEFDFQCQQDKGFYCQTETGECAPKRGPGEECGRDSFECLGFCARPPIDDGICLPSREEGEFCNGDLQCDNLFFNDFGRFGRRPDRLICNIPSGRIGRCVRESLLITRLGAKCDPDNDRCDARRALSCHPTRGGHHVCQHRNSRFDFSLEPYCEPRSTLSRCAWGDEKTECRLERDVPGQFGGGLNPYFRCRRKSDGVPRGGLCITEYAACTGGTECKVVPGVRPTSNQPFSLIPPFFGSHCVHIAQEDEFCGDVTDKFTTQCAAGLRCKKGKCVKAENNEPPFDGTETHLGPGVLCSDLPCAPGLVCDNTEFDPEMRCLPPLRIVGKGRECTDRAVERRRCKDGLVCALRRDGMNVKRCREPRKAGDYCQDDDECTDGLVCPAVWTKNREQEERRCYDPKTTLKIGDKCDPEASFSQARCVVNERAAPFNPPFTIPGPMRCMPKGDGFACRVVVELFASCDDARDITCDIGQKCGNLGVCFPAGENSMH